jgi:hypothetical protein
MKLYITFRYCLFISFIFHSLVTFGQTSIDGIISIKFPGQVKALEAVDSTAAVKARLKALYFNSEKESYIVFKTTLLKDGQELTSLPADIAGLADIYHHLIEGQIAPMRKKGFAFKDSVQIKVKGYVAYKLKYLDVKSGSQGAESILFFLNGVRYVITYSKVTTYSEKNKDDFFNSLQISDSKAIKQIANSDGGLSVFNFILTAVIVIGLFIFFKRASKNQSPFGMNFKRVYCPVCGTKQPIIRMPGSISQTMIGGTTCPKCQANLDKYGKLIP